jgi:hypothetical protein
VKPSARKTARTQKRK